MGTQNSQGLPKIARVYFRGSKTGRGQVQVIVTNCRPPLAEVFSLHVGFVPRLAQRCPGLSSEMSKSFHGRPLPSYSHFFHATTYTSGIFPVLVGIATVCPLISSAFATKPITSRVTNESWAEGHVTYL